MTTSCEFRFRLIDVTAREDATLSVSENQSFADIEDTNLEEAISTPQVVTLEPDFGWPLGTETKLMPDQPEETSWGWWSVAQSGADGSFENPPTLIVDFSEPHSSAGVTLTFVGTLPGVVNIVWYDLDGTLLDDEYFSPDDWTYFCDCQVENYGRIEIAVISMSMPHRYMRMTAIVFGALKVLGDSMVTSAILTEEIHPVSFSLPVNTLELGFYNSDGTFALLSPVGAYKLFQYKQEIEAYQTVDGEETFLGNFYVDTATGTVDAETTLSCICAAGVLAGIEFYGGVYVDTPVGDLLDELLVSEDFEYSLDDSFSDTTVTGYLPICTKREALRQLAFAIGAIVQFLRDDSIQITPVPITVSTSISPSRKILGHEVTLEDLVTQVDVTAHSYSLSSDLESLNASTRAVGTHTITFSSPVSVTAVAGGTLVESHPNYCIVSVTTAQEVTVSGYKYEDSTSVYSVSMDSIPAGGNMATESITDATLVDAGKASAVAQRVYDFYQNRYTDKGRLLPGAGHVGEVVELETLGGITVVGQLKQVVTDLYCGGLMTIEMRGEPDT